MGSKRKPGRPRKMAQDATREKLFDALRMGVSLKRSCAYARVSVQTVLDEIQRNAEFAEQIEHVKAEGYFASCKVLYDSTDVKAHIHRLACLDPDNWSATQKLKVTMAEEEVDRLIEEEHRRGVERDLASMGIERNGNS